MQKNEDPTGASKSVKVYVRILPLLKRCENCAKISQDKKTIYLRCLQDMKQDKHSLSKDPRYWSFLTDGIFYYSSQDDIYRQTTKDIIHNVLDGGNFVLVCCGQTGTGKSFTAGGFRNNWEHRGLVPRLLTDLMIEKEHRKRTNKIQYSLSYLEFCGKKFKDLLNPNFVSPFNSNSHNVFQNITKVSIKNEKVALQHIFQGEGRRALARTSQYPVCNLGTSVITFHIRSTSLITSWAVDSTSVIHIVEMAGIGNTRNSNCSKSAHDVISANSMKLELEQFFINFGSVDTTSHLNARSSYLLRYLGNALKLKSFIRFIAHVKVTIDDLDVSLSTLRFVGKIAKISIPKVAYDVRPQNKMFVEKLQEEIERLKRELYMNEMFFHQESSMNVSAQRAHQIRNDFLDFLNGSISDIELISLAQSQVLTKIMKDFYTKITVEKEDARKDLEKCENSLKNAARMTSKTSSHDSAKVTSRKNPSSKDLRSVINGNEDIGNSKVGALEENGITLGPGTTEIPATSKMTFSNLAIKNKSTDDTSMLVKKSYKENEEISIDEYFQSKSAGGNVQKTFERLQEMLKRVTAMNYGAGSLGTKRLKETIVVPKTKQQKNRK